MPRPHVNTAQLATGQDIQSKQQALREGDAGKNCAIISAAGAVNLVLGHSHWTSGLAAQRLSVNDFKFAMGNSHKKQAENIIKFVGALTGRHAVVIGPTDNNLFGFKGPRIPELVRLMSGYPNRTVFAVFAAGPLRSRDGLFPHWLNAIVAGGLVRFFDFQSNAPSGLRGSRNAATSRVPFIAIVTQTYEGATSKDMHRGADQAGEFDLEHANCFAIAFPP